MPATQGRAGSRTAWGDLSTCPEPPAWDTREPHAGSSPDERSGDDEQPSTTQQMAVEVPERWRKQSREAARASGWRPRPATGRGPTPGPGGGRDARDMAALGTPQQGVP